MRQFSIYQRAGVWTSGDLYQLRRWYPTLGPHRVAALLFRTPASVILKAEELGLIPPVHRTHGTPAGVPIASEPAPAPTRAAPGTRDKIDVLAQRALAGCELWHDADAEGHGEEES